MLDSTRLASTPLPAAIQDVLAFYIFFEQEELIRFRIFWTRFADKLAYHQEGALTANVGAFPVLLW
jgi:hypothetical protein